VHVHEFVHMHEALFFIFFNKFLGHTTNMR